MKIIKKLNGNTLLNNLAVYIGGSILGQMIGIFVSPVLARLYSPQAYGVQSLYLSLLSSFNVVSTLSYHNPIPISEEDEEGNLVRLSFLLLVSFSFGLATALTFGDGVFFHFFRCPELKPYKYLIPVGAFFVGSYNILTQCAIKQKAFPLISKTKVAQGFFGNLGKIIFGFLHMEAFGLILGNIIGQSSGVRVLWLEVLKKQKGQKPSDSLRGMKRVLLRYKKFAYLSTPCSYIYTLGSQFPVMMLSALYGSEISGYYSLAHTVVYMPCSFIGMALSQVFYSELAQKRGSGALRGAIHKLLVKIAAGSVVPFVLMAAVAPKLVVFVYGSQWQMAGKYAGIMVVQVFFYFLVLPVNKVFEVYEKQQYDLVLNVLRLAMLALIFIAAQRGGLGPAQTIFAFAISEGLVNVTLLAVMEWMLKKEAV